MEPLSKDTAEMRTPPLIRTLEAVPRVSGIEGIHCSLQQTHKHSCSKQPLHLHVYMLNLQDEETLVPWKSPTCRIDVVLT